MSDLCSFSLVQVGDRAIHQASLSVARAESYKLHSSIHSRSFHTADVRLMKRVVGSDVPVLRRPPNHRTLITMDSLISLLARALNGNSFQRLILSQPLQSAGGATKVTVRPIEIAGKTAYQWTARVGPKELHENLTADQLRHRAKSAFGTVFGDAHLFTTEADTTLRKKPGGPLKIKRTPSSMTPQPVSSHNREKQYLIPVGKPCRFLSEIGVMLPDGKVRPAMYHKFRQINRYLEFVDDVLQYLPSEGTLNVVDFGCGKSYLTFALHHLLTKIHKRTVSIVGLDLKEDVIEECSQIAKRLDCEGLRFEMGRIDSFDPTGFGPSESVHLTVSLHACDTATDDALAAAIRWQSNVILAVPCCQHELNQTLSRDLLFGLTGYGILRDQFASLATDALRARLLEVRGYKTQVLEFIELEHTPKNVLLRAVRRQTPDPDGDAYRTATFQKLKADLGLETWHLERALAEMPSQTEPSAVSENSPVSG